ncbi:hypothetical protein [Fischerella sp. JS2]|uniref:hypothetical protein n=1 Tax=Fischerella sp. JS2 TaxID=2597771 RepID=UPI0028E95481|nr:hypothetical protein [Fischerella sp. JS2]
MSGRRYPPAYLRYLKTRLWNLARPSFWGTAIFLAVVGLVVRKYWKHPDFFYFRQYQQAEAKKPVNSSLSEEDKAIAADIDNLPILFYDFTHGTLPSTATNVKQKTKVDNSNSILESLSKQKTIATDADSNSGLQLVNPASTPKLENPFVVQTENLLQFKNDQNNSHFLGVNGITAASMPTGTEQTSTNVEMGFINPVNYNHNATVVSPLQTALNQSSNQSSSLGSRTTSTQTNSLLLPNQNFSSTTGLNGNAIAPINHSTNYPNQYPNLSTTNVQSPTSAVTSITPTQSSNVTPSYTPIPSQSVVNSSNGDASSLQQPTQLPQNNPPSPSQFPGLYTGERQINGISYPR